MSVKAFYPFLLLWVLVSCRPETPADVAYQADSLFVSGMRSMQEKPRQCGQEALAQTSFTIDISAEGTVNKASSLLAIFLDDLSGNGMGCSQMIYFGPYSNEVSTVPFYFNDKGNYFINVQLIDTANWIRYMWAPDAPVLVKPEMQMHLLHNNHAATKQIEFE